MAKTIKLKKKEMKALKEQIEEDEGSDEWFKEVSIGHNIQPIGIRNLLKDKYKINAKVEVDKYGDAKILASVHTKKEMKRFDKFLDDINNKIVKGYAVYLYVKE